MRTKLLLPLVALALVATALPASAQESIDAKATLALDGPVLTYVGNDTYVLVPNPNGGPFPNPYDVILLKPNVATPPGVRTSDIQRRGPQHL
jgi:hypothetical protein